MVLSRCCEKSPALSRPSTNNLNRYQHHALRTTKDSNQTVKPTSFPTLEHETRLWQQGFVAVAGIDEAGRGALAGPVTAGAVILSPGSACTGIWATVNDSKLLTPSQRAEMADQIREAALAYAVGSASAQEIDEIGIAPATKRAMQRAVAALTVTADYLLIDWVRLDQINIRQESFTKGDQRIVSIAAASILAKTTRDAELISLHEQYPVYGFAGHKGYAAATHLAALAQHGPCAVHRHSFAPIRTHQSLFDQ
jgi:ribonuclease HII